MEFTELTKLAIKAAISAGKIIRQNMNAEVLVETKAKGSSYATQVVTEVDKACEKAILAHLQPTCLEFDLAILTEETEDDGLRFTKDYFWCIDPLDGTLAFINRHPGFSVSIALVSKDGTPIIGVVYDPSTDTIYHAIKGKGAYKNHRAIEISQANQHLTYVTDKALKDTIGFNKINDLLDQYAQNLNLDGVKEIAGAGAVLNAIFALENAPACMIKLPKKEAGGGSLWDYAATACIYNELNFYATDFEGSRLDLNKTKGTFMNELGICYTTFRR